MGILKESKIRLRRALSHLHRDQPALLTFLFHGLFRDKTEIQQHHCDPQQRITIAHIRGFIDYFLAAGYHFVAPGDLGPGLDSEGRYILISFDDGYYNNTRMLPILEDCQVPAAFFVTSGNIIRNECFWWDVVYRERHRQGWTRAEISAEQKTLKTLHHNEIIAKLKDCFGHNCLAPWSDADRVMTAEELRQFAAHPLVSIGNHTSEHYLLDNYSAAVVSEQISRGQQQLEQLTGARPDVIAYPNGNYSPLVVQVARRLDMRLGITVDKRKNRLPIDWQDDDALQLGRFVLWGDRDIATQCDIFRSDIKL